VTQKRNAMATISILIVTELQPVEDVGVPGVLSLN